MVDPFQSLIPKIHVQPVHFVSFSFVQVVTESSKAQMKPIHLKLKIDLLKIKDNASIQKS